MADVERRVSSIEVTVEKLSQKIDDHITEMRRDRDRTEAELQQS